MKPGSLTSMTRATMSLSARRLCSCLSRSEMSSPESCKIVLLEHDAAHKVAALVLNSSMWITVSSTPGNSVSTRSSAAFLASLIFLAAFAIAASASSTKVMNRARFDWAEAGASSDIVLARLGLQRDTKDPKDSKDTKDLEP